MISSVRLACMLIVLVRVSVLIGSKGPGGVMRVAVTVVVAGGIRSLPAGISGHAGLELASGVRVGHPGALAVAQWRMSRQPVKRRSRDSLIATSYK